MMQILIFKLYSMVIYTSIEFSLFAMDERTNEEIATVISYVIGLGTRPTTEKPM